MLSVILADCGHSKFNSLSQTLTCNYKNLFIINSSIHLRNLLDAPVLTITASF